MMENIIERFIDAMRDAGLEPSGEIFPDGNLHRFTVPGDRKGSLNGWYVLHADSPEAGTFGCWKRRIFGKWRSKPCQNMDPSERRIYKAKLKAMKRQHEEEQEKVRAECMAWCANTWNKSSKASDEHPYLRRKVVKAYGLKSFKDALLVPVRNTRGELQGVQFIMPDGSKKFKSGTTVAGCYYSIGKLNGKILIVEGYATGATIHEITGHAAAIAFDCGNLLHVAKVLRGKYPDTEIIACADDDHLTKGNPGLSKATEAARAVNGKLAVPIFPDNRGPKDTDFNDLMLLAGREAVNACIEKAAMPPMPNTEDPGQAVGGRQGKDLLEDVVQRLAGLSTLEYERARKQEADKLGVRASVLDAVVKDARKGTDDNDLPFIEADPWPEPIDPASLLSDIAAAIRRFIVCNMEISHAATLWVAMTWFIDAVQVAPMALITAPEKRCGKTQLLSFIGRLAARAIVASSISPAALYRTIEAWCPTLLIDEADAFMKDNEELRGLLNSGHTRDSAYVIRTVGENFIPTKFSTWGAKAIAGIGHIADTLMDRGIILELRRKLPDEKVDRMRHAELTLFDDLRSKLARFAEDYSEKVSRAIPPLPDSLNDRAQDNWEPLLAIAMVASDEWLKIGIRAALKLSKSENVSQTVGVELLADIHEIFEMKNIERISTTDLIKALCIDDEKHWATYYKGAPINPRQLAKKLDGYGIHSKTVRLNNSERAKGFERSQFKDAFLRYVAPSPENIRDKLQTTIDAGLSVTDKIPSRLLNDVSMTDTNHSVTDRGACHGYKKISVMDNSTKSLDCHVSRIKEEEADENIIPEDIPVFTENDFQDFQ